LSSEQTEQQQQRTAEETTVASAAEGQSINVAGAKPEISTASSGEELKLVLGEFAGPLDLLLYLIRQEQVSIYDIPIARITDEYLRYLRMMGGMDITVASDELVERLLEHQKYKAAAEMLWSRATVEQAVYTRAPLETDKENPEVSAGAFDLLRVFQQILARRKEEVLMEIERDEVTMAEMLERLRNMIFSAGELNMRDFFERTETRRELVLAFLSVLELVRTTQIRLVQSQTFGDIVARVAA
jgi:segregation and condensation protein A